MEHDARKMTALAILLLLLGAGVVGVGYAAFSGTASTYNQGNSATAGYIYLDSVDGSGDPDWTAVSVSTDVLPLWTYTYHYNAGSGDADYVAYYLDPEATPVEITIGETGSEVTYRALPITGADKTYTLHNATNAAIDLFDFTVKEVNNAADYFTTLNASDFKYIMKITCGDAIDYVLIDGTTNTAHLDPTTSVAADGTAAVVLQLYIGYDETGEVAIPNSFIDRAYPVANLNDSGSDPLVADYDQYAHEVAKAQLPTKAPLDLSGVDFAFTVKDTTA